MRMYILIICAGVLMLIGIPSAAQDLGAIPALDANWLSLAMSQGVPSAVLLMLAAYYMFYDRPQQFKATNAAATAQLAVATAIEKLSDKIDRCPQNK